MRKIAISLFLIVGFSNFLHSQTQFEMNQAAGKELQIAGKRLNYVYHQILIKYAKNLLFLKNLKAAQKLWIQFRDAQLAMKFPDRPQGFYGGVLPMCQANYLAYLTNTRTKDLEE